MNNQTKCSSPWQWQGAIAFLSALLWLSAGAGRSLLVFTPVMIMAAAFAVAGIFLCLRPTWSKVTAFTAIGCLLAALVTLPLAPWIGWFTPLLLLMAAVTFTAAGWSALTHQQRTALSPHPRIGVNLAFKAAIDAALLAYFALIAHLPAEKSAFTTAAELNQLDSAAASHVSLIEQPAWPDKVLLAARTCRHHPFTQLSFESGYTAAGVPGGDRWRQFTANQTAYAWLLRHPGPPRPWLICIHGYRMGWPAMDLSLFPPAWLHHKLGLNLAIPTLPLHGPRTAGRLSGDYFLDGDLLNPLHAERQTMGDIRRLIAWLRQEYAPLRMGVLGFSLGGYNAALLATLEHDLACVIAGIPATDLARLQWQHMPRAGLKRLLAAGVDLQQLTRAYGSISPLNSLCLVPWPGRFIFAGTVDQVVPPEQVLTLWRHWGEPLTCWYAGGHLTFRRRAELYRFLTKALTATLSPPG